MKRSLPSYAKLKSFEAAIPVALSYFSEGLVLILPILDISVFELTHAFLFMPSGRMHKLCDSD